MVADLALIDEIEDAIANGSERRRGDMLRRVTDLFIVGAVQFSDEEVALFDDVIARLAVDIELSARAMLATRLAPIPNAPPKVVRKLAFDDAIDVAGPVLAQSERLDDPTLVENAMKMGPDHLFAISRRKSLSEEVTDVLVERGDQQVALSTAGNRGARFSEFGFAKLIQRSDGDDSLATCVGSRPELPRHLFVKLLAKASQSVRQKLAAMHPNAEREINQLVAEVANRIQVEATAGSREMAAALKIVESLHHGGQLDDRRLQSFAKAGRFEETTAAFALLCELPLPFVERAMAQERPETVLILAKAIGLSWATVKAILLMRAGKRISAGSDIAQSLAGFERLMSASAQEILRFYRRSAQTGNMQPN
jgi:uncharacterized protein (DUF2336 family)